MAGLGTSVVQLERIAIVAIAITVFVATFNSSSAQTMPSGDEITVERICKLIAREANQNGLPPAYFARLIWKESRFDAGAVSPAGAQGIAQFMPATAALRQLKDPFDPEQAIPASARYLSKLRIQFGNLGLASAAYNAGEQRVTNWLKKGGTLPLETENYVLDITGEPADSFFDRRRQIKDMPLDKALGFLAACARLPIIKTGGASMARSLTMPWVIQVAGNYKKSVAERSWRRIRAKNRSIVEGMPAAVSRSRTAMGRRGIYTVRIGAASRSRANAVCSQLRANGTSCLVKRN